MLIKKCLVCEKEFEKKQSVSLKTWNDITKYCSKGCQKIGVGLDSGLRFTKLNKSRIGIPLSDEAKEKRRRKVYESWYARNKERISAESKIKYLSESLDKKNRRKILLEARNAIPGVKEKRLAYHIEYRKKHQLENHNRGQTDYSKFKQYISSAKRRNYILEITFEQFIEMFHSSCNYCGLNDCRGIDRVDNKIGYTSENSVPCCEICNKMKWKFDVKQFIDQVNKIYKHNQNI